MRSHYNLNIFKFSASGQNCTHPAFWPAARVRRTSVFTAGENLGAGAALPTPSIEIPKGGDRLWRSEPKTKGHPFGCPFVLSCPQSIDAGQDRGPAQRGGAFAPYKRFAAGKTLAQGQFTCPEHFKFPRYPKKEAPAKQVLLFLEVPPRFELGSGAFAELCLTTWLWHRMEQSCSKKWSE